MIAIIVSSACEIGMLALVPEGAGAPQSFMDSLPDPMKLQLPVIAFVILIVALLFLFLKHVLFEPLTKVMDGRDETIQSGKAAKTEAATQIELRHAEFNARLRELRAKASEHRKALTAAVMSEKEGLLETARQSALAQRAKALAELKAEQVKAESELRTQVEALSQSMVQHLLKQA